MEIKLKFLYCKLIWIFFLSVFNLSKANPMGGGGLGYNGRLGVNMFGEFDGLLNKKENGSRYFISIFGPFTGDRTHKNTYSESELSFDEITIETQRELYQFVGGLSSRLNSKQSLYFGGGITAEQTFLKKYDNVNNFPFKNIYFVQDDEIDSFSITITFGVMIDTKQGIFNLKKYGCLINISPSSIGANFIILWSGNLLDYL